jgi:hypothetical protein
MPREYLQRRHSQPELAPAELPPAKLSPDDVSHTDRFRAVASILARGVARWRVRVKAGRIMPVSAVEDSPRIGLEVPDQPRPQCVSVEGADPGCPLEQIANESRQPREWALHARL